MQLSFKQVKKKVLKKTLGILICKLLVRKLLLCDDVASFSISVM